MAEKYNSGEPVRYSNSDRKRVSQKVIVSASDSIVVEERTGFEVQTQHLEIQNLPVTGRTRRAVRLLKP